MSDLIVSETEVRRDLDGRYCLNDLHRAAGGEKRHAPNEWLRNTQTADLIKEVEIPGIPGIVTKQRLGTFVCKELVYAYAMWISPSFHLKVIRAYDSLANAPTTETPTRASESAIAANFLIAQLNLTGSAKLGILQAYAKTHAPELLPALPVYAIDAPPASLAQGSSQPTRSATELLREHAVPLSAKAFNVLAERHGFLEQQHRKGSKGSDKKFWSVTEAGLAYGKNVTSPSSPRETQPHWYGFMFSELLEALGVTEQDER